MELNITTKSQPTKKMPSLQHIHTYIRRNKTQMMCADPYCTHIIETDRVVNKVSLCSKCKEREIILTKENLKRKFPTCLYCSGTKVAKAFRERETAAASLLSELGIESGGSGE